MRTQESIRDQLAVIGKRGMIAGVAGLVLLIAGGITYHEQFFESYLYGSIFWIEINVIVFCDFESH